MLSVVFGLEVWLSWVVSGFLQPELSPEIVRNLSEKSWGFSDCNERLVFLKKELEGLIDDEEVSSCSPLNSTWKINQVYTHTWCCFINTSRLFVFVDSM